MRGVSLWQLRHGAAATTRAAAGYTSTATASRASTACRAAAAAASRRSMATKPSSRPPPGPKKPPPFPTVPTCPSPTCGCADTPAGLDIDHKSPLNGVMTGYAEHVLVCTGQDDWASRIEEENGGDNLAADLKELFGRGGEYTDVGALQLSTARSHTLSLHLTHTHSSPSHLTLTSTHSLRLSRYRAGISVV